MVESPTEHRFIRSSVLIITVITIASLLPFITKAFNVDEPLFLWTAQQIQINPLDFYGFKVNWYGTEADMSSINKNPPLVSYYIALVTSLFGWKETVIHAFFIIPAVALSVGIYFLARSFCSSPCLAAILAIFNPVFLVSSTSVMTDTTMLAFYVWAIFLWREGLKNERVAYLFISAIFITLSSLTKYFGLTLIPLLFVFTLAERRKFDSKVCFLFIPILLFASYDWLYYNLYNHSLLSDAAIYSLEQKSTNNLGILYQTLIGLTFTGGCLLGLNFFLPILYRRNFFLVATLLLILLVYVLSSIESIGPLLSLVYGFKLHDKIKFLEYSTEVRWGFVFQIALFGLCGLHILILAISDLIRNKDASALLLFIWVFGTFIFYCFLNWTTSARNILPILPAASILVIRRINFYLKEPQTFFRSQFLWPLLPAVFISFLVAYADASWANSQRSAAQTINQKFADDKSNVMFQGHWGFQYYMESLGYKPIDFKKAPEGNIMIIPTNNTNLKQPNMRIFMQIDKVQKQTLSLLSLSGWYSSLRGPLPFALGMTLPEDYIVYSLASASGHLDLGNIFFSQKKFKDAISHYKEAVKIKPKYVAAHNNLGNALVQEGKIKEAITHYRKALSISPDLIEARKNLELAIRVYGEAGESN